MAVGLPLVSSVQYSRSAGIVTTSTQYETLHINGVTGRVTRAHALTGMMTKFKYQSTVVQWVRENLPHSHALSLNGWTKLPANEFELSMEVAIPGAADP